jgi:sugar (pentulose or hexulose) kinase
MYDDRRATAAAERIARTAPAGSPARSPTSSLAKLIHLQMQSDPRRRFLALHQADWITGRLSGHFGVSDWNNVLKLGYDARDLRWPRWVRALVPDQVRLPRVLAPGERVSLLAPELADQLGWPRETRVLAGTTDSTAAVVAAGARDLGDAVTALGSTLVLKILSDRPIEDASYGIYSQRYRDRWLVGGASNSGGAILRHHFTADQIQRLSEAIDPSRPSGLAYYPLLVPGERFPRNDPHLTPVLSPRPTEPHAFLHGILEGIAQIEREGYQRLAELGAPLPRRIWTIGGGAANRTWTRIRERILGIPVVAAEHQDAAYGAACLARDGDRRATPRP